MSYVPSLYVQQQYGNQYEPYSNYGAEQIESNQFAHAQQEYNMYPDDPEDYFQNMYDENAYNQYSADMYGDNYAYNQYQYTQNYPYYSSDYQEQLQRINYERAMEQQRILEEKNRIECLKSYIKIARRATGKEVDEEYEAYLDRRFSVYKEPEINYAQKYDFRGTEKQIAEFNKTCPKLEEMNENARKLDEEIERMGKDYNPIRDAQLEALRKANQEFLKEIPLDTTGKEFAEVYGPRLLTHIYERKQREMMRNLSPLYNKADYNRLLDIHKRGVQPQFNPNATIDDLEIKLPMCIADQELMDKRKKFIESIMKK